ncbi:transglycosylase SLT domain-containing protein [Acidocella sp.]|uniref:transglycosylase SLT domain-containing protein n=1 Tax=Acidocella sp. TaxID=50710 RepID=UPI002629A229|nr:transglycosylase SLT domain-containing protein [Acidocella sp.]
MKLRLILAALLGVMSGAAVQAASLPRVYALTAAGPELIFGPQGPVALPAFLRHAGLPPAGNIAPVSGPDEALCAAAGQQAEKAHNLPANLLISIGDVESGRADALTGRVSPWPWTINVDGQGQYFASKQAAIEYTRLALSSGAHDVDVGCFQVSLQAHPGAFASLDDAFDPAQNADYAARFVAQLQGQTGSWATAIADYHSASPDLGLPYQRLVLAAWRRMGNMPLDLATLTGPGPSGLTTGGAVAHALPDGNAVLQTAAARAVHVYALNEAPGATAPGLPHVYAGLPRIIEGGP